MAVDPRVLAAVLQQAQLAHPAPGTAPPPGGMPIPPAPGGLTPPAMPMMPAAMHRAPHMPMHKR